MNPASRWLAADDLSKIERFLFDLHLLQANERVTSAGKPGDGNMNLTLRVTIATGADASKRTLIVKQARPWVEKYPQIAAPVERSLYEQRFYEAVAGAPPSEMMPRLLAAVPEWNAIVLEDVGPARDCTWLYAARSLPDRLLTRLFSWLKETHSTQVKSDARGLFANRALRELNHQHVFVLPFSEDFSLDLDAITPGLGRLRDKVRRDHRVVCRLRDLGALYLEHGPTLVHGDFFPGSWLQTADNIKIIDPEFCHMGRSEWDLAILRAHLGLILGPSEAETHLASHRELGQGVDESLVAHWAAAEVLRRLLGVAQLGLDRALREKQDLIEHAVATLERS